MTFPDAWLLFTYHSLFQVYLCCSIYWYFFSFYCCVILDYHILLVYGYTIFYTIFYLPIVNWWTFGLFSFDSCENCFFKHSRTVCIWTFGLNSNILVFVSKTLLNYRPTLRCGVLYLFLIKSVPPCRAVELFSFISCLSTGQNPSYCPGARGRDLLLQSDPFPWCCL